MRRPPVDVGVVLEAQSHDVDAALVAGHKQRRLAVRVPSYPVDVRTAVQERPRRIDVPVPARGLERRRSGRSAPVGPRGEDAGWGSNRPVCDRAVSEAQPRQVGVAFHARLVEWRRPVSRRLVDVGLWTMHGVHRGAAAARDADHAWAEILRSADRC